MPKRKSNGTPPVRLSSTWQQVAHSTCETARLMTGDDSLVRGLSCWLLATHLRVYHLDDPSTAGVDWHEMADQILAGMPPDTRTPKQRGD